MSDRDADHAAQRRQMLARIEHDREQLAGTLDELRRPLHTLNQLQKNTRAIVPALFAAGAAFLILGALRSSSRNRRIDKVLAGAHRGSYPVVQAKRSTSWFAWVLKVVSAYRITVAVGETLRSLSQVAGAGSQPTLERNPT